MMRANYRVPRHFRGLMKAGRIAYEVWCWLDIALMLIACTWVARQQIDSAPNSASLHLASGLWVGFIIARLPAIYRRVERWL